MDSSEPRDFTDGGSEILQEASPLVHCFWCERNRGSENMSSKSLQ